MITYYAHSLCKHPAALIIPGHWRTSWSSCWLWFWLSTWRITVRRIRLTPSPPKTGWCRVVWELSYGSLPPVINNKMENVWPIASAPPLLTRPTTATDGMINAQLWRTSVGVLPRRGEHRHCEPVSESVSVVCHHTESEWQYWRWFPAGRGQGRQSEF